MRKVTPKIVIIYNKAYIFPIFIDAKRTASTQAVLFIFIMSQQINF